MPSVTSSKVDKYFLSGEWTFEIDTISNDEFKLRMMYEDDAENGRMDRLEKFRTFANLHWENVCICPLNMHLFPWTRRENCTYSFHASSMGIECHHCTNLNF